jgi:hypothetical protein
MPKPPTDPPIINNLLNISIRRLRQRGLLHRDGPTEAELNWANAFTKEVTHSIGIVVFTRTSNPYISLNYSIGKEDYNFSIPMVKVLSNLRKGHVWYFLCPKTNRKCSKLFLLDSDFVSRKAVLEAGGVYQCNLRQMRYRTMQNENKRIMRLIETIKEPLKPYFMGEYNGRPTKRQLRINRAWDKLKIMGLKNLDAIDEYMGMMGSVHNSIHDAIM